MVKSWQLRIHSKIFAVKTTSIIWSCSYGLFHVSVEARTSVRLLAFLLASRVEREAIYQASAQGRKLLQTDKNIRATIICMCSLKWKTV